MAKKSKQPCYQCGKPGTSREHAPPDSFFPKGLNANLITVPSCDEHNLANARDVEYVRNLIVTHIETNDTARGHFRDKVLRSLKNSPKLENATFGEARPIIVDGLPTAYVAINLDRFKRVMSAIAYAIYYHDHANPYRGLWEIFSPSMVSTRSLEEGVPDPWDSIRELVRQLSLDDAVTGQPTVFRYQVHEQDDSRVIYVFTFYDGFQVVAVGFDQEAV